MPETKIPLKPECFTTTITLMALRKFGPESLDWEPETLRDAFEIAYGLDADLPQRSFDKLNCGYALVGTNTFTNTIEGFLTCTAVMNGKVIREGEIPYCTVQMCAWSIWEYMNLLGEIRDGKPTEEFHPDIIRYIQEAGRETGLSKFPSWMSFAEQDNPITDLTGDVNLFEMYNARQLAYISDINRMVRERQEALKGQLKELENIGILG